MDHGAALGLRFNCKGSVHQFQSLLHADEPKTTALLRRFGVKACAGILHWEMNLIRCSPQSYFEVSYPTVLRGIVQGFLQYPKEGKRNVRRQRTGQIVGLEVNLRLLLLAELLAEASHCRSNTQILQFCRVQLMRQGLNISGYLRGLPPIFNPCRMSCTRQGLNISGYLRGLPPQFA